MSDSDSDVCLPAGASSSHQVVSASAGQVVPRGPYQQKKGEYLNNWRVAPPPSVVALIAKIEGKGSDFWAVDSSLQRELDAKLMSHVSACRVHACVSDLLSRDPSGCFVVGFALVASWEFVDPNDSSGPLSEAPLSLMVDHFRSGRHERSSLGFVANKILEWALLRDPFACAPSDLFRLRAASLPEQFSGLIVHESSLSSVDLSVPLPVQSVVSSWLNGVSRLHSDFVFTAFLDYRLACLLAVGALHSDLSCVVSRDKKRSRLSDELPPRDLENAYLSSIAPRPGPVVYAHDDSSDEMFRQNKVPRYGCLSTFSPHHLMRALQVDKYLKVSGSIEPVGHATLRLLFPRASDEELRACLDNDSFVVPSEGTLRRARARLDAVAMLAQRKYFGQGPHVCRYLNFDKSLQKEEILICTADVVVGGDAAGSSRRLTPLSAMAYKHCGMLHVGFAIAHKAFLESGPSASSMQSWFASVRGVVTDHSSVESGVVDLMDIVPAYLRGDTPESVDSVSDGRLFLLAMRVIGVNHTVDSVLEHVLSKVPFWKDFESSAKAISSFLRNRGWRSALVVNAGGLLRGPARHPLHRFSANFAVWRWGTLHGVCRELLRVSESLRLCWDVALFKKSKSENLSNVDGPISSPRFWQQLKVIDVISSALESFRSWSQGCRCHADECVAFARKGKNFPCGAKSRRGPELWDQLQTRFAEWRRAVESVVDAPDDYDILLQSFLIAEGHCRRKFGYCDQLPWLLWRARDSLSVASRCLQEHDSAVDAGRVVHRVSSHFLAKGCALRSLFEQHAGGGAMHPDLDRELAAYEQIPLDETPAEAGHRDVTRLRSSGPNSELGWWAATTRLSQNLQVYEDMCHRGLRREFVALWGSYKSLLQIGSRKSRGMVPLACSSSEFFRRVYLLGEFSFIDLSWLSCVARPPVAPSPSWRAGISAFQKSIYDVKIDHLTTCVEDGCFYSVCDAVRPDDDAFGVSAERLRVFQVIEKKGWRSKTSADDNSHRFRCGVMAQVFSVQELVGQPDRPSSLVAAPVGDIQVLDVLSFAPFPQLSKSLTVWQGLEYVAGSGGCVSLSQPSSLAASPLALRDGSAGSSFAMLCCLKESGWQVALSGQRVPPFVAGGDKIMTLDRAAQRKSYLLCLLDVDNLFARGLTQLLQRDGDLYYRDLLAADQPSTVLALADRKERPAPVALEDQSSDASSDAQVFGAPRDVVDSEVDEFVPASRDARARRGSKDKKRPRVAVADFDAEFARDDVVAVAPPRDPMRVAPPPPAPLPAVEAGAPVGLGDVEIFGPERVSVGSEVVFDGVRYVVLVDQLPLQVSGIRLERDLYLDRARPEKNYDRVGVTCPLTSDDHKDKLPCHRWRRLEGKQDTIFGNIDAVGFLGVWLNRACGCASKKEHMCVKPRPNEVVQYLLDHGFVKLAV